MSSPLALPRETGNAPIFHPDWGTHANANYHANVSSLDALLGMVFPISVETAKSERCLRARRLQIENDFSGPWSINIQFTMLSWQVAMRVSAVEVYLRDALAFLALFDPEFIRSRGSKQDWDYDSLRTASDNDDALWTFCDRWARAFIGDGGPERWASSLEKSGLGKFDSELVKSLEGMWGYRHMRIHNGAKFSREFITRHPALAASLKKEGLQQQDLQKWSDSATTFVDAVEKGITGRLRARIGEKEITDRENLECERQMKMWEDRRKFIKESETPEQTERRVAAAMQEAEERFALMREFFDPETTNDGLAHVEQQT